MGILFLYSAAFSNRSSISFLLTNVLPLNWWDFFLISGYALLSNSFFVSCIIAFMRTIVCTRFASYKNLPTPLTFLLDFDVTAHFFSVYFSIFVSVRLTMSHCVSNLYHLVGEKQGCYKRVTNTVQKWAEKGLLTMIIADKAKIKGAQNERLTNQWWLMLIVCKYVLLADAVCVHRWLSIV